MKALITIIILLIVGVAAWLVMRGPSDAEVGDNNAAAVGQAIQNEADNELEDIDLGEFQDKG